MYATQKHERIFLPVTVRQTAVTALLNGGAEVSTVTEATKQQLTDNGEKFALDDADISFIKGVNGALTKVSEKITLPVRVGNHAHTVSPYVLTDGLTRHEMILGYDYHWALSTVTTNYRTRHLLIHDDEGDGDYFSCHATLIAIQMDE